MNIKYEKEFKNYIDGDIAVFKIGMIKGRHELPVSEYIFEEEIKDVFDINFFRKTIFAFLLKNGFCSFSKEYGLSSFDWNFNKLNLEKKRMGVELRIYVTGLTNIALHLADIFRLIKPLGSSKIFFSFYNFDVSTNTYRKILEHTAAPTIESGDGNIDYAMINDMIYPSQQKTQKEMKKDEYMRELGE